VKRIAVYCGSATPADARFIDLAREVGDTLARRGIGVVYGGGRLGLMGAVAGGALAAGGEVIGVIPEALVGANGKGGEVANHDCTELAGRSWAITPSRSGCSTPSGSTITCWRSTAT